MTSTASRSLKPSRSVRLAASILAASLTGPFAMTGSAGAETADTEVGSVVDIQAGSDWATNSDQLRLQINGTHVLISRMPERKVTDAQLAEWNKTVPELSCVLNIGYTEETVTSKGVYTRENGYQYLRFDLDSGISSEVDVCTLSNSTYLDSKGTVVFPVTTPGMQKVYGDPATIKTQAEELLKSMEPALASLHKTKKRFGNSASIAAALAKATGKDVEPVFGARDSAVSGTVYVARLGTSHRNARLVARGADGQIVVMNYSGPRKKITKWEYPPLVIMERVTLTDAPAVSPVPSRVSTSAVAFDRPIIGQYEVGRATPIKGLTVRGFDGKTVLVGLGVSAGTLQMKAVTGVTASFGFEFKNGVMRGKDLLFFGAVDAVNAALKDVMLLGPAKEPNGRIQQVRMSAMATEYRDDLAYFPQTQHFYRYLPLRGYSYAMALEEASRRSALGLTGYLATITSAEENEFVSTKIAGELVNSVVQPAKNVWVSGSDRAEEGTWKYDSGPEKDTVFWKKTSSTRATFTSGSYSATFDSNVKGETPVYEAWVKKKGADGKDTTELDEPNDWADSSFNGEDCLVTNRETNNVFVPGGWNDLPCTWGGTRGFIVEFGASTKGGISSSEIAFFDNVFVDGFARPAPPAKPNFFKRLGALAANPKALLQKLEPKYTKVTVRFTPEWAGIYSFSAAPRNEKRPKSSVRYQLFPKSRILDGRKALVTLRGGARQEMFVEATKGKTLTVELMVLSSQLKRDGLAFSARYVVPTEIGLAKCPWCSEVPGARNVVRRRVDANGNIVAENVVIPAPRRDQVATIGGIPG